MAFSVTIVANPLPSSSVFRNLLTKYNVSISAGVTISSSHIYTNVAFSKEKIVGEDFGIYYISSNNIFGSAVCEVVVKENTGKSTKMQWPSQTKIVNNIYCLLLWFVTHMPLDLCFLMKNLFCICHELHCIDWRISTLKCLREIM